MSKTLTAVIGADTSGLTSALNEAKSALSSYRDATKKASGEIGKTASASDSQVAALQRVVKALDKVQSGSLSASQAQKSLKAQIAELKIQWANLSDEVKNSDFGSVLSETLSGAENALKQLNEQIKTANKEISNIGSTQPDTSNVKKPFEDIKASVDAITRDFSTGNIEGIATHLNSLKNINLGSAVSSITSLGKSAIAAAGPIGIAAGAVVAFGAAAKVCIGME